MAATRRSKTKAASHSEVYDITVEGIPIQVTRKDVRNISLRIRPAGQVVMSAPRHMPKGQILAFAQQRSGWLQTQLQRAAQSPMVQAEQATPEQIKQWREAVEQTVPYLIQQWEPIMGVHAGTLAYRNMRSRWGSCQPTTGRICINIRLALYPPRCLEYVVVHELCHLLEGGHGKRFHTLMDGFMPDWRERRALLR